MEGIVKINRHTAQTIEVLDKQSFIVCMGIANGSFEAFCLLDKLEEERLLEEGNYTYVYMPEMKSPKNQKKAKKVNATA